VPSIRTSDLFPLEDGPKHLTSDCVIDLRSADVNDEMTTRLEAVFKKHAGHIKVLFSLHLEVGHLVTIQVGEKFNVSPSPEFIREIEEIVGPGHIAFFAAPIASTAPKNFHRWSKNNSNQKTAV
jgi:hypothetical protein